MIIIVISKSNHREQPKTPSKYRIEHILNNVKVSRKIAQPGPQKHKPATKNAVFLLSLPWRVWYIFTHD
jgi:hypothetical protein